MKLQLKEKIDKLADNIYTGYISYGNERAKGKIVIAPNRETIKLILLKNFKALFESCLPKKRIAISEDPHTHNDFSFNEAIDYMKSNFKAILEGKGE